MNKVNSFNKKLISVLMLLVIIISALTINQVIAYTTEMKSESDYDEIGTNIGDTAQTTYEDLVKYYSVLCCEHGRELVSKNKTILRVTYGNNDYTYDAGDLTANDLGMKLFEHRVYSRKTDFSASSYTSYTWGHYEVVETHIATPKEAYILAEMSAELEAGTTLYYKILTNEEGERERYYGGVFEGDSYHVSETETIYYINHTYVLETEQGNFYVGLGHDSEGNSYYVFKTYSDGSLREYGGSLEYGNDKNGAVVKLEGVHVDNVYYEFNGVISAPGTVAPGSGTLYLLDYDTVVNIDGTLYECELEGGYSYIQIAWWSTEAGSKYNSIPVAPNTLAMEAEAFEAYILNITGKTSVSELEMIQTEQEYVLHDEEGNEIERGYITAPKIEYNPSWNEDANQNGEIEETDEVTVAFDSETNQYKVGPFSINYVKDGAAIESRLPVDFSCITGTKLLTNIGELELGKDWYFEWQYGERTQDDTSEFPNPNEVFYILIDYKEDLTKIENFHFDFKYMNAGGLYNDIRGYYFKCTWGVHIGEEKYRWEDFDEDGEYDEGESVFWYRNTWISFDDFEERRQQSLAHAIIGVRWYEFAEIDWTGDIPEDEEKEKYAYIELEKNVIDDGGEIVNVNDTFIFDIYIDKKDGEGLKFFETISFDVVNGHGEAKSSKITWKGDEAPTYKVEEVEYNEEKYTNDGPWTGTLVDGETEHVVNIRAINTIKSNEGHLKINKLLLDTALESETFTFLIEVNGEFEYEGQKYDNSNSLSIETTVNANTGWAWESNTITWYGTAPTYKITEIIPEDANYHLVGKIVNGSGSLLAGETVLAVAMNDSDEIEEYEQGSLQIQKVLLDDQGNEIIGREFVFDVTVGDETFPVTVKSGSTWRSEVFTWKKGEEAPSYYVVERNTGDYTVIYENQSGNLVSGENSLVTVKVTNKYKTEEKESRLRIRKELILNDKKKEEDVTENFNFLVTVKGSFKYKDKTYTDQTMRFEVMLNKNNNWTWTSEMIYWYDEAPSYSIEEIDLPSNWELVSMSENASGKLEDGITTEVVCINEWNYETVVILTMEMGGKVWDDTDRSLDKHVDTMENGKIDETEPGIEKVLVTVYRVVTDGNGNVLARLGNALVYDENDHVTPLENSSVYTDSTGNWSLGSVAVPAFLNDEEEQALKAQYGQGIRISYDVEFAYDGQTYEPTTYLATSNGDAASFRNASTSERDAWLYDSMTIDNTSDRKSFNSSFEKFTGDQAMDTNGNTVGYAEGNGETKNLYYTSEDTASMTNSDVTRKVSTLETRNNDGYIYDEMILRSLTSTGSLLYPFDDKIHIKDWDKITTDVFRVRKEYSATYNYLLSINLGLIEREYTDGALEKDLNTATVVVNGKALKYKYNRAIDLDSENYQDLLYKQLDVENNNIEYSLGLYSSDYYYRASVYNGSTAGAALDDFYTRILGLPVDSTEMDVYLTYLISIHNESETYDLRINELADYFDTNLELITSNSDYSTTHKYIQQINGKEVNAVTEIAENSKATYYTADNQAITTINVNWTETDSLISGSDGVQYTRISTSSLMNQNIVHGGRIDLYVTFRVEKDSINEAGIYDTVKLGKRYNLAEIESYSSFYSEASRNKWSTPGEITGRVDEDSAPNNINVPTLNDKKYYEDDTDSSPSIKLELYETDRNVEGIAFEDAQTTQIEYEQYVGDGVYDSSSGDKVIPNMKTEIVEIVRVPLTDGSGNKMTDSSGSIIYKDYEFEWPTDTPIAELGNRTLKELIGFEQEVVTDGNGKYTFTGVPSGNYIVRFIYGDDDQALITGNTDKQLVYNGQDYKTTSYQTGFENLTDSNGNGYVDNEWHDLTNESLSNARVSDARDSEARRLYITSKSEILTYGNTSVLATADDLNADHTGLFGDFDSAEISSNGPIYGDGYYMYADTAKLNLTIENLYEIAEGAPNASLTTFNVGGLEVSMIDGNATVNGQEVGTTNFSYTVKNIDCGIEERSKTALVLDKQIKEMILRTSDGNIILDAIYDISYHVENNKVIATVVLNEEASIGYDKLSALNRSNSAQGYRYIMAEGIVLQGTTLEIKYQLRVFNISETDRCNQILKPLWESVNSATTVAESQNIINNAIARLATSTYTENSGKIYNTEKIEYGMYFGSIYYLGKNGSQSDDVVETKVHQLIDYVDNDAVFTDLENIAKDQTWSTTTIEYLLENNLIDPRIVQIVSSSGTITGDTRYDREATSSERYTILDEDYQEYVTEVKNNLVLNSQANDNADGANPSLVKFLEPYAKTANLDESSATINLYTSRFFASEDDTCEFDNLAEIIKAENIVGRRDIKSIAGNVNPFQLNEHGEPVGEYVASLAEPDSSATELITLSPPTGIDSTESRTFQLILVVLIATIIVAVGIVIIKKKVLVK